MPVESGCCCNSLLRNQDSLCNNLQKSIMNRSGFRAYPHLTEEEFGEICHYLDRRYSRATLGATRKEWRLSVHTSLNVAHGAGFDFITYLQITCPLAQNIIDDDLSAEMDRFTLNNGQEEDIAIVAMETSDQVYADGAQSHLLCGYSDAA